MFEPADAAQIRTVKEKIEADKGEEYYADGLKLIFSGTAGKLGFSSA